MSLGAYGEQLYSADLYGYNQYLVLSKYSYGTSAYGSNAFGTDVVPAVGTVTSTVSVAATTGIVKSASASMSATSGFNAIGGFTALVSLSVSASSSTSSSVVYRVRESGANPQGAISASARSTATFIANALSSVTASTASVGEQFVLQESDQFSYGTAAYGYNAYDNADLQTISSATSVSSSATCERKRLVSASASAAASTSAICDRIKLAYANTNPIATTLSSSVIVANAASNISTAATVASSAKRVRESSSIVSSTSPVVAIGREKWEIITNDSNIWTIIAA